MRAAAPRPLTQVAPFARVPSRAIRAGAVLAAPDTAPWPRRLSRSLESPASGSAARLHSLLPI
eukprot:6079068-Prymnesium_polylepis.1